MRKITAATLGLTAAGIAGAATIVPGILSANDSSRKATVAGTTDTAAKGPKSPAQPSPARPPHKSLVVHEDGIVIPTLVPGGSGLITVPVSNPDAGDIAMHSITALVTGDLAPSCRDDIGFGTVVERGTVLTKKGSRATAVEFHLPVSFSDDPSGPQDCKADSYTITFTATGSGK